MYIYRRVTRKAGSGITWHVELVFTGNADDVLRPRAGNTVGGRRFDPRRFRAWYVPNVRIHHARKMDPTRDLLSRSRVSHSTTPVPSRFRALSTRRDTFEQTALSPLYRSATHEHLRNLRYLLPRLFYLTGRIVLIRGVEFENCLQKNCLYRITK